MVGLLTLNSSFSHGTQKNCAWYSRTTFRMRATYLVLAVLLLAAAQANAQPFAYVTNALSNNVSVIDLSTNTVVTTIPLTTGAPVGIELTPDGTRAYGSRIKFFQLLIH